MSGRLASPGTMISIKFALYISPPSSASLVELDWNTKGAIVINRWTWRAESVSWGSHVQMESESKALGGHGPRFLLHGHRAWPLYILCSSCWKSGPGRPRRPQLDSNVMADWALIRCLTATGWKGKTGPETYSSETQCRKHLYLHKVNVKMGGWAGASHCLPSEGGQRTQNWKLSFMWKFQSNQ